MSENEDTEILKEFKQLLQEYKNTNIPEANWRLHALLRRLGLTKYEIQAYIALIESVDEQNVTEIVKNTGIPHPRAYDTLRNLVKYGLITPRTLTDKIPADPQKRMAKSYRALEPAIGVGNLFAFFQYAKEEAIKELQNLASSSSKSESGIWEIHGKDNIINIIKLMINEAKYEVLISAPIAFIQILKIPLIEISKRKIQITCVSNFEEAINTDFILEGLSFIRLRIRSSFPMPYIVIDRTHAIQWNFKDFKPHSTSDPEFVQAQVIDKVGLIDTLIDHFFFLNWRLGKPVSVFQKTSLPCTFIHCVNIVEEVEKLIKENKKPKVVVKGNLIGTEQKVLRVGEVTRIYKNWESGIFTIYIKTEIGEEISVGGFGAIYEDIAADQVTISF